MEKHWFKVGCIVEMLELEDEDEDTEHFKVGAICRIAELNFRGSYAYEVETLNKKHLASFNEIELGATNVRN